MILERLEETHRGLRVLQTPAVKEFLNEHIQEDWMVVDPFSGWDYERTTLSNSPDNNPEIESGSYIGAGVWMDNAIKDYGTGWADAVILNPWHWNQAAYRGSKEKLHKMLKPGGIAVTVGWSSTGFRDVDWRYEMVAGRVVCFGENTHDLIITVERKGR